MDRRHDIAVLRRIANLFRRTTVNREIEAELEAHIALRVDDNIACGMSPEEARRDALLRFGNTAATRERVSAADMSLSIEGIARDLRYALRQLRHSPGFAFTAILTLALGIGANVIVFGVLNAIVLHPLNVASADRLFQIEQKDPGNFTQSYPDYLDYRARSSAFSDLAAYRIDEGALSMGGSAQRCWLYEVSGNYFDMLGVKPELGRLIHGSDEHGANSAPYIVLSDGSWRTYFAADPGVIGMTVDLDKHPYTIIGVAPRTFNGTELFFWPDLWMPIVNEEQIDGYNFLDKRFNHGTMVIGAIKRGISAGTATENLSSVARQLTREHPSDDDGLDPRMVKPGLMGDVLGGPARPFLAAVMVLALLVLLAACVNLAGIFAARSTDRARELAIRLSIGSTRGRLLRQVLTEAILISLAGGILGTVIAAGLLRTLSAWQPIAEFPIHVTVVADRLVYLIAFGLSLFSGILPGLLPAPQIWKTDAMQAMKSGAATQPLARRLTVRDLLLGVQIALCGLLVTASLVSLRGMERSLHAPMGFQPQNALLADTDVQMSGYSDRSSLAVQRKMLEETARIPGITAVGIINDRPLGADSSMSPVYRDGTTNMQASYSVMAPHYFFISPGYLQAAETRLLAGRDFSWRDDRKSPQVAIVNETFARKMFGNGSALGSHFVWSDKVRIEVVGVVEDGKYDSLAEDPKPAMFLPLAQNPDSDTTLVIRSKSSPAETAAALSRVLAGIDPSLPFNIRSWSDALALVLFPARVATAALGVMGLLAAMLAVTGVFGMAAYTVSKRLRELGIRMALGAHRAHVVRAALGRPLVVLMTGSMAGLALGVLASRLLAYLVYEATPRDPLVLLGALVAMIVIGLMASWIPARRALAVSAAQLLREE
jgi:predicted permease